MQAVDRVYSGADLTVKFAAEIAGYPSVWDWIKARIQAANFIDIHVGDYIPFTAGNNAIKAEIAGIDTYYRYGDAEVGHHIDFISRDCWPEAHAWNKTNFNNGTTVSPNPWLASDIYAWLNSLQMDVPNAATADPALVAVDYRTTGVYDKLPAALKNVIVQKRFLLPTRYAAGTLLTDDTYWLWTNSGNLWLPTEAEVDGQGHWSTRGYGTFGSQQYPIFAQNMRRVKGAGDGGGRSTWWLLTAHGGVSTYCGHVSHGGDCHYAVATHGSVRAPLCFRIA
jgi:hypothetical protein